ncbi:MAG: dihydroorotase [Pseudomonadota bacterium]
MQLTITQPDDWHLHLRDGSALATTVAHSAAQFSRVLVMPNLKPPVTTVAMAMNYRQRIMDACPDGYTFDPKMTLYLTEQTRPDEVARAGANEHIVAFKYYPAGATTNSDAGVRALEKVYPLLEAMQEHDVVLCLHGEVVDPDVDIFDRERVFIERSLASVVEAFPNLRIVLEHITTRDAAQFVATARDRVAATITPQHLLYNRNAMLVGGIRPHYYCLPILKSEQHRQGLIDAALSGSPRFFLGTDSAPHTQANKENACGCAGVYSAHAAIELYAEFFDQHNALDKLDAFSSEYGAAFYGVSRNTRTITLKKESWRVPDAYPFGGEPLVPFQAGTDLNWRMEKL